MTEAQKASASFRQLQPAVLMKYRIGEYDLLGPSQRAVACAARREMAHKLRDQGYTVSMIGRLLKRDHSSIVKMLQTESRNKAEVSLVCLKCGKTLECECPDLSGEWAI